MKKPLLEAEKNYLKCAILMLICGVVFFSMKITLGGGICTAGGVLFLVVTLSMYMKKDDEHTANLRKAVESKKLMKKEAKQTSVEEEKGMEPEKTGDNEE